jgi:hypothetical protein
MSKITRTINPLHFEDLEPHRFEDLIRQLVYDFREWESIEAIGRLGSDEGMDVRATEQIVSGTYGSEEPEDAEDDSAREQMKMRDVPGGTNLPPKLRPLDRVR